MGFVAGLTDWLTGHHSSRSPSQYDYSSGTRYNMPPQQSSLSTSYGSTNPYSKDPAARSHRSRRGSHDSSSLSADTEHLLQGARPFQPNAEQTGRPPASGPFSPSPSLSTTPSLARSYAKVASSAHQPEQFLVLSEKIEKTAAEQIDIAEQYEAAYSRDQAKIEELKTKLEQYSTGQSYQKLRILEKERDQAREEAGRLERRLQLEETQRDELGRQLQDETEARKVLETAYQQSEDVKEEAQRSSAQARAFLDLGDAGDLKLVETGLNDINAAIEDVAFRIFNFVVDSIQTPVPPHLRAYAADRAKKGRLSVHRLLEAASDQAEGTLHLDEVFHSLIRVVLCEELFKPIFLTFHPLACSAEQLALLSLIIRELRKTGHQAKIAQWRATSYEAMDAANPGKLEKLPSRITSSICVAIFQLIKDSGFRSSLSDEPFFSDLQQQILGLVTNSLDWHKLHRQRYHSTEFDIIFPAYSSLQGSSYPAPIDLPFDETTMKRVGGDELIAEQKGSQVVATLAFGLAQVKVGKDTGGQGVVERTTLVKAKVWTASDGGRVGTAETDDERCPRPVASSVG